MKKTCIPVLGFVCFLLACNPPVNNSIIGKWKKDTMTLTVNEDHTQRGEYTIPGDITHTPYDVTGTYTLSADTFQFVNLSGLSSCPVGDTGTYTYQVNNNQLTLVLVSDQCSGRGMFMPGTYTRQ
jgi:hypothetical protein